jgi:hypothetical protein
MFKNNVVRLGLLDNYCQPDTGLASTDAMNLVASTQKVV